MVWKNITYNTKVYLVFTIQSFIQCFFWRNTDVHFNRSSRTQNCHTSFRFGKKKPNSGVFTLSGSSTCTVKMKQPIPITTHLRKCFPHPENYPKPFLGPVVECEYTIRQRKSNSSTHFSVVTEINSRDILSITLQGSHCYSGIHNWSVQDASFIVFSMIVPKWNFVRLPYFNSIPSTQCSYFFDLLCIFIISLTVQNKVWKKVLEKVILDKTWGTMTSFLPSSSRPDNPEPGTLVKERYAYGSEFTVILIKVPFQVGIVSPPCHGSQSRVCVTDFHLSWTSRGSRDNSRGWK